MARLELKGVPVSPGIGIGGAFVVVEPGAEKITRRVLAPKEVEAALANLEAARARAVETLKRVQAATARELGDQEAAIYGAQVAVLHDPAALGTIRRLVREEYLAPETAIQELLDRFETAFRSLEGADARNWAADLRDPWNMVLRALNQEEEQSLALRSGTGVVLVAEELAPSLVVRRSSQPVRGIVCTRGGRFSHGAVLARSSGIPTVVGVDRATARIRTGEAVVVAAEEGRVLAGASAAEQEEARTRAAERADVRRGLVALAREPGRTACGAPVQVLVNLESPRELETFDPATAEGVGLFRTEFAYMERPTFPSESEQAEIYEAVLQRFPGRPVVFRTLDIGSDKRLRYFEMPSERNPAMGWRGLRVSLQWRDLFLIQLKALSRARRGGDAQVLLPMVTTLEELRAAKRLQEQVWTDANGAAGRLPVGVMIEVPAAVMALRDLARESDFVSVGTNDLAQYLYAVDRDNPWVADLYQPYHPAHLRVLLFIARTCGRLRKACSVCGEMAGQPAGALFLVGAGFRRLSVASPFVAETKALIRAARLADMRRLAARAAAAATAGEAQASLEEAAAVCWRQVVGQARATRA